MVQPHGQCFGYFIGILLQQQRANQGESCQMQPSLEPSIADCILCCLSRRYWGVHFWLLYSCIMIFYLDTDDYIQLYGLISSFRYTGTFCTTAVHSDAITSIQNSKVYLEYRPNKNTNQYDNSSLVATSSVTGSQWHISPTVAIKHVTKCNAAGAFTRSNVYNEYRKYSSRLNYSRD
jgi:hypothetical protein